MSSRSLKNYNEHKTKILNYAQAVGLTVEFKSESGDGVYLPSKRKIRIDIDLDESTEIATLLHELGHALDDAMTMDGLMGSLGKAYSEVYNGKPTKRQLAKVLECEAQAWKLGRVIARKLRIKLGKWYNFEEQSGLNDYSATETR